MAHYDSAPVSLLYLPSMVKTFRRSLLISLALMVAAFITALIETLGYGKPVVAWLRWVFIVYFLGQGVMAAIDYLRFDFIKGAADNATGAAATIATAERLWRAPIPGWEVTAVLTGAEEAGIPSLTLCAQDSDGQIPNLHRPEDTIENVDTSLLPVAVKFAEATIRRLAQSM